MFALHSWQQPLYYELLNKWKASKTQCVLNALPTGTGKTYIASEALRSLKRPVLVICPKSIIPKWHEVLGLADVKPVLDVINWEQIRRDNTQWWQQNKWIFPKDTVVVVDEVHKGCSGSKTKTTNMLGMLRAYNVPVLMQSATVADSPLKMRAIGYLLGLHGFNATSYYDWCRRHACYNNPFHNGLVFSKGPLGTAALQRLHKVMADMMVRYDISKIPGFPTCQVSAELYDLEDHYKEAINNIYSDMETRIKEPHASPLVELQHARERVEHYKLEMMKDMVPDFIEEGKSVVVFVNFRSVALELYDWAYRAFGNVSLVIGDQDNKEREANRIAFQNNTNFLCICTTGAGGLGIDLHDIHHIRPRESILFPGWSAVDTIQALGRVWRSGGTPCVQRFILAAGTAEERVYKTLQRKMDNIETINDGDLI